MLLLGTLINIGGTHAQAQNKIPTVPHGYWLDQPQIVSPPLSKAIQKILTDQESSTGESIVIAILANIGKKEELKTFSQRLFAAWKVGKYPQDSSRNMGTLLVIDWESRQAAIVIGIGREQLLTHEKIDNILTSVYYPELTSGHTDRAIALTLLQLLHSIESPLIQDGRAEAALQSGGISDFSSSSNAEPISETSWWLWTFLGIVMTVIVLGLLTATEAHYTSEGWYRPRPWGLHRMRILFWLGTGAKKPASQANLGGTSGAW